MKKQYDLLKICCNLLIIISLITICTLFLPFASAKDEYAKYLNNNPTEMYSNEINMKNSEAVNISLCKFGKMFYKSIGISMDSDMKGIAITRLAMIIIFLIILILMLFLITKRKPIATIIFSILSFGVFRLFVWDLKATGALPNTRYGYGVAYYMYYVLEAIIILLSICVLVGKRKNKEVAYENKN